MPKQYDKYNDYHTLCSLLYLLSKSIFRNIEEPVLAHLTNLHSKKLNVPFQNGNIRITFLYPENITRFDDEANEYVYLFQRVEGFPFSQGITSVENRGEKNLKMQISKMFSQRFLRRR